MQNHVCIQFTSKRLIHHPGFPKYHVPLDSEKRYEVRVCTREGCARQRAVAATVHVARPDDGGAIKST